MYWHYFKLSYSITIVNKSLQSTRRITCKTYEIITSPLKKKKVWKLVAASKTDWVSSGREYFGPWGDGVGEKCIRPDYV